MPDSAPPGPGPGMAPVWVAGVLTAGATALAAGRPAVADPGAPAAGAAPAYGLTTAAPHLAGTLALSLVLLACWGVLLVTRGRARRVVAVLGLLAALAALVLAGLDAGHLRDDLAALARAQGREPGAIGFTAWFWVAWVAGAAALAVSAVAVRRVGTWPAMGSRYDAPGARTDTGADTGLDLWRAQDEGRDPTSGESE